MSRKIVGPVIYKTTNLINGNVYVGQHYTSANDGYLGSGIRIKRAIKKYGIDNFQREILEHCTSTNINDREKYWIRKLDSYHNGYNLTEGGDGCLGLIRTPENIEKIKKYVKEHWDSPQGQLRKQKLIKRLNEWHSRNDISGENNPMFGKSRSIEEKNKISQTRKIKGLSKGRNNTKFKYVYLVRMNNSEFIIESLKTFCQKYKLNYESLRSRTRNKNQFGYYKDIYIERMNYETDIKK